MLREPTVLLRREPGQGSPCCGIDVLCGSDAMLVLVGHGGLTLHVRVKGGHGQQEEEKLARSSTHSLILGTAGKSSRHQGFCCRRDGNPVVSRLVIKSSPSPKPFRTS